MTASEPIPVMEQHTLHSTAEYMSIPIYEFSLDLHLVFANKAGLNLLGADRALLEQGVHVDELISSEFKTLVHRGLEEVDGPSLPTSISLRVVRRDGIEVPVEAFAASISNEGKLCGFVAYVLDMSRRQMADEKLQERSELLKLAIEHSRTGLFVIGSDYKFEYTNDGLCEMVGRTRGEVLHHDFREFLHPDSITLVQDRYVRRQRGEKVPSVYEFQVVHKDGRVLDVQILSLAMQVRGGKVKTVAQLIDITEDLKRKYALTSSEHRFRSLVESMIDGLAADNEQGTIVYANDALAKMMGYSSADEVVGLRSFEILDGFTQETVLQKTADRRAGKTERYETSLIHRNGSLIPVIVSASPMLDEDKKYVGSFAIFSDVSELRQAEAQSRFLLDLLLHDIGNQLQLILGGTELCTPGCPMETIQSSLQYIRGGTERCLELIKKIRIAEEARFEPLEPTNLVSVLLTEAKLLQRLYEVRPTLKGIPRSIMISADPALSQLLWNLLENSVKHNPKKDRAVWITGKSLRRSFELRISDNGPGLTEDEKANLYGSKRRFGGVGLHIVRTLAAKYGFKLTVEDRVSGDSSQGLTVVLSFRPLDMS